MNNTRKLIGAAAFSVALAGGGIAGALLGTPGTSAAQEEPTSTTTEDSGAPSFGFRVEHRLEHLEAAAEALGVTVEELRTQLQAGSTIAEIAAAEGVDVDAVIDALVADATEDIRERITAMVNGEVPAGGQHHHRRPGFGAHLETLATTLDMTEDELRTAFESGQSIAEIAEAEGVDLQTVIDALVAEAEAHLDEAVANGRLTQEEADAKKAELETRITERVNDEGGFRGGHVERGPRP